MSEAARSLFELIGTCFQHVIGYSASSTFGSNTRRIFSRSTLFASVVASSHQTLNFNLFDSQTELAIAGLTLMLWSAVFFLITLGWAVLLNNPDYPVKPDRLIFDILISALAAIVSFALYYQSQGIIDTLYEDVEPTGVDFLYFSIVTFSTLGFGDFRPTESMRIIAAAQAIYGNLHLGLLAGAIFFAIQKRGQ